MDTPKKFTIRDIARLAKVHPSTVSRVLNGETGVGEETRERVRELIDSLGYYPDSHARGLGKGRAGAIGVITPRKSGYVFSTPFYWELLHGVADVVREAGLDLILVTEEEESYVKLFKRTMADGVGPAPPWTTVACWN